jgi:hypothetical protein
MERRVWGELSEDRDRQSYSQCRIWLSAFTICLSFMLKTRFGCSGRRSRSTRNVSPANPAPELPPDRNWRTILVLPVCAGSAATRSHSAQNSANELSGPLADEYVNDGAALHGAAALGAGRAGLLAALSQSTAAAASLTDAALRGCLGARAGLEDAKDGGAASGLRFFAACAPLCRHASKVLIILTMAARSAASRSPKPACQRMAASHMIV